MALCSFPAVWTFGQPEQTNKSLSFPLVTTSLPVFFTSLPFFAKKYSSLLCFFLLFLLVFDLTSRPHVEVNLLNEGAALILPSSWAKIDQWQHWDTTVDVNFSTPSSSLSITCLLKKTAPPHSTETLIFSANSRSSSRERYVASIKILLQRWIWRRWGKN